MPVWTRRDPTRNAPMTPSTSPCTWNSGRPCTSVSLGRPLPRLGQAVEIGRDRPARQHHALGQAGRARGVHDQRRRVRGRLGARPVGLAGDRYLRQRRPRAIVGRRSSPSRPSRAACVRAPSARRRPASAPPARRPSGRRRRRPRCRGSGWPAARPRACRRVAVPRRQRASSAATTTRPHRRRSRADSWSPNSPPSDGSSVLMADPRARAPCRTDRVVGLARRPRGSVRTGRPSRPPDEDRPPP